jgi:hypothetical protein
LSTRISGTIFFLFVSDSKIFITNLFGINHPKQTPQIEKDNKDTKDWEEQHTYQLRQILCLER